ncbi:YifB family Mg chelatase-like AAA ATPase [Streptomyces sp. ID03-2B]|uniref:YifB family Mg chelatase-like AAA ATPase n=1 Tax=Streptomyces caviscabies TaxID=90079 RepID=A0ABW2MAV0_9ACTN|nr:MULTISPECIES: YifB family Mg chelatase-like AAA ATPase [unclassified Streptomyces]MCL6292200.1 YifB family Mg chelatase-like AAA ATPase [Streptomyces sp. 43Y-GA-1]MDX3341053.1 YifB family Mg chelatase-like AAA ATPase [Streptomyces sp. ME02-6979.5a]MDX3505279.1 YifB family Mg chelatase-like AAA ATPase [Streptomyces sp. ATCC51928]MDX3593058.1 YifB family Mg chelatase-like AAA ATPase [Streptomyces sp. ID03-2B]MDX5520190.1 YifB family Mg chelatase-like AAA ATPase [Streptomyces sp. DE06-01C]
MGFARACSVALVGVEGVVVEVQADLEPGVAAFTLVGLPDKSLVESRDRVRAAVVNSGAEWPQKKLTVGLSPASVPKSGSGFDLAVASAVLGAAERIDPAAIADVVMIGELGLDGRVRPVRGVLPAVLAAAEAGYEQVVVPEQSAGEAALVPGISVLGVRSLRQLIAVLCDEPVPEEPADDQGRPDAMLAGLMIPGTGLGAGLAPAAARGDGHRPDLADVAGQPRPRRALEVAAAGGHHLLFSGPPGAGKTMLAERLSAVLPPLTRQESLEVTAVHSVAGILPPGEPLVSRAPYCAPHHSATMQSLVGGGNGIPRPGAVSLAHRGVLFLDEAPEFSGKALDALRQPLESGHVVVARAAGVVRLPARFLMVLAANPCPCGRHTLTGAGCECPPSVVRRYQARLSGPLLDRVDLRVEVEPVDRADLLGQGGRGESTAVVAARVRDARARAAERLAGTPWTTNSEVPGHELRTRLLAAPGALAAAERDLERGILTARGLDRVLRVAWTVADLRGADRPDDSDVAVALELRTGIQRGVPMGAGER